MNAKQFKGAFLDCMEADSGLERHRPYLGMSAIGNCARALYDELVNGRRAPLPGHHWRCWLGLLHEAGIGELMYGKLDLPDPQEVVAAFDQRYKGHPDFQLHDDATTLVEVKTLTWGAFCDLRLTNEIPINHRAQATAYMQHGPWDHTILLYIARDTPNNRLRKIPAWTFDVWYNKDAGDFLDDKARKILDAVDHETPPACLCGRHLSGRLKIAPDAHHPAQVRSFPA